MGSFWAFAQNWKVISLIGLSALPFSSLLFLNSKDSKFNWTEPKGVNAHIKFFILNESNSNGNTVAASLGGGTSHVSTTYEIVQASSETSQNNTQNSKNKLALVAKMPLISIENLSSWEYCLPTNSPLTNSVSATKVVQTSNTEGTDDSNCDLQFWSSEKDEKKEASGDNKETIKYLLELSSKFIRLQHQINMIYLFHASRKDSTTSSSSSENESFKKVKLECGFIDSQNNNAKTPTLTQQMLLTVTNQSKKCLSFPLLVHIYLKLKGESSATVTASEPSAGQTESSSITTEKIKSGKIWGSLSYGLTDYWGNVKQIKSQNGSAESSNKEGPVLIDIPLTLNYDLSASGDSKDNCANGEGTQNGGGKPQSFDHLWKKYEDRSLRLCDYFSAQQTQNGKS